MVISSQENIKTYSKVQRLSKLLNSKSRVNRKCSLNKGYDDEGWNPRSKDIVRHLQKCRSHTETVCEKTEMCRTRVMSNVNGPEESGSRGNFSFATINLPLIALDAKKKYPNDQDKRIKKFFDDFDQYIYMSKRYLEKRYEFISHRKAKSFSFLMGQGVWMDSEKLGPEDEIGEVLKHASLSIGFCGLAECLVALVGHHHGESEDAQKLGLKIVGHLREMTDKFTEEEHMNWSTFGTPKRMWA